MPLSLKRKKKGTKSSIPDGQEGSKPSTSENGQPQTDNTTPNQEDQSTVPNAEQSPVETKETVNGDPPKAEIEQETPPKGEEQTDNQTGNKQTDGDPNVQPSEDKPTDDNPPQDDPSGLPSEGDGKSEDQTQNQPSGGSEPQQQNATLPSLSSDSFVSDTPSPSAPRRKKDTQIDDLLCVICKTTLVQPKIMPCMHSVCQKCERAASRDRSASVLYDVQHNKDEETVHCPKCNEDHVLPTGGFPKNTYLDCRVTKKKLQSTLGTSQNFECGACDKKNPSTHYCSNCTDFLCAECNTFHRTFKATKNHNITDLSKESLEATINRSARDAKEKLLCPQHTEAMAMFCEQCEVCICSMCLTENHMAHPTAVIDDKLAGKQKDELRQLINDTNTEIARLEPESELRDQLADEIHAELKATQQGVARLIDVLQGALASRRDTLNNDALSVANRKLDPVRKQKEAIMKIIDLYRYVQPVVYAILGDGTPDDIALAKSVFVRRQTKLNKDLEYILKPLSESTAITLRTSGSIESVSNALAEIGYVCGGSHAQNSRIRITYKTTPEIALVRGDKLVCEAVMKDARGHRYTRGGERITANLMQVPGDNEEHCFEGEVIDNGDGTYIITFNIFAPGKNILTVKSYDEDLANSPMELTLIVKDINMIGEKATVIDCPEADGMYRAIAVGQDDTIAITDSEKRRVCVLGMDGTLKKSFGSKGTRDGTFKHKITGAVFDPDGNLYVTDDDNGRLQKFRLEDGQVLNIIGEPGGKPGKLDRPRGLAFHEADQKLYISEFDSHRISVFLPNGQHRHCFGKKGHAFGKLKNPLGLAFGPDGNLYVVDSGNNRIQVFTPEGDAVRSFNNKYGSVNLNQPWDIVVTTEGYVLVTERSGNCVSVFHSDGTFILQFGSKGSESGKFDQPCGIAINGQGQVFVMDSNNKRIQMFTYVHK